MLDSEVGCVHLLLTVILDAIQEILAGSHLIDVSRFKCQTELRVRWEPAFLALPEQSYLQAF
jgi:hypothetical protein